MSKVNVIIELEKTSQLQKQSTIQMNASITSSEAPKLEGVTLDKDFGIVPLPQLPDRSSFHSSPDGANPGDASFSLEVSPIEETFIVRGKIEESKVSEVASQRGVIGIYSDVLIQSQITCGDSDPVGDDSDVERALSADRLRRQGADGTNVLIAIVDTGINMAHLRVRGKSPSLDVTRSWVSRVTIPPSHPANCQ